MAENNTTAYNDKYFFRNERLPITTNVPRDVTWAIADGPGAIDTSAAPGDSSYVGEIVYNEQTGKEEWQPYEGGPVPRPGLVKCPTPIISGVISQRVAQNSEGIAKTNVVLSVDCIDDVEYEVVVTPA